MTQPTPQEVDDLLAQLADSEYDYWLEECEPSDDPPEGAEVEHCGTVTLEELDRLFEG